MSGSRAAGRPSVRAFWRTAVGGTALVRVAALSVEASRKLCDSGTWNTDDLAVQALRLAADATLIAQSPERERASDAVHRYVLRMGTRATPFGLFAGTAVVELGAATDLTVGPRPQYRAIARADMGVLERLVKTGAARAGVELVPVRLNPTLARHGSHYRYVKQGQARPEMMQVPATDVLTRIVQYCRGRTRQCGDIMRMLTGESSPPPQELKDFIERLVTEETFLVGDFGVLSPGHEPSAVAAGLLDRMRQPAMAGAVRQVAALERPVSIGADYARRLGESWQVIEGLAPTLDTLPPRERYNVELRMPVTGMFSSQTARHIAQAAALLNAADEARDLLPFMQAFEKRFGDSAVPLLEAADLELGLLRHWQTGGPGGTGGPGRIGAPGGTGGPGGEADGGGEADQHQMAWGDDDLASTGNLQVAALGHWLAHGEPYDIAAAGEQPDPPTVPLSVLASLIGADGRDGGPRAVLLGTITGCPGALTGRFALGRAGLQQVIGDATRASFLTRPHGDPGAITAELVYTPGGRIGNVLIRPGLTEQALVLRGGSGPGLPLDQLVIRLEEDKLALYDGESGRRVILQLSSAHNTSLTMNDPLYRLLGRLADRRGAQWAWGQLRAMAHLPRVVFRDVLVARERWLLTRQQVEDILASAAPERELRAALPGLGDRRWAGCGRQSSPLAIDLDDGQAVRRALSWAYGRGKKKDHAAIWELPEVEFPAVRGPDGDHVAEVSLTVSGAPREWLDRRPLCRATPASEWLYFKYYCGPGSGDDVIRHMSAVARDAVAGRLATKWFFVRYEDEEGPQIRIRLRSTGRAAKARLYTALEDAGRDLAGLGLVSTCVPAEYVPEVRRYGGLAGMELAEELFYRDSEDVATRLDTLGEDEILAAGAVDLLLWWQAAIGGLPEALACMRRCHASRASDLGLDVRDVGKLYREELGRVNEMLRGDGLPPAVHDALTRVASAVASQWGKPWREQLTGSLVHMHCNRLLGDGTGRAEAVAYEFAIKKALQLIALRARAGR